MLLLPGGSAASGGPPSGLMQSLQKRGLTTVCCTDPFAALEHLCAGPSCGPKRVGEGSALVIVEPAHVPRAPELAEAAERYAPAAPVWRYDSQATPRLAAYTPPAPPSKPPQAQHTPSKAATPPLKLAGDGPAPEASEHLEPPRSAREILTEDELAMLLADDPEEGPGTTRGATR